MKKANEVIENLLTCILLPDMINTGHHMSVVQDRLIRHPYIRAALKYLRDNGGAKTWAHSDWIKMLPKERKNCLTTGYKPK